MRRSIVGPIVFATFTSLVACSSADSAAPRTSKDTNATEGTFGGASSDSEASTATCSKDKSFYDVPGDGCDNDDDGIVDNPLACDASAGTSSAVDFARTIGICDDATTRGFGLVSATFTQGYGVNDAPKPEQHNVLTQFGNVLRPREGTRLGVLSTGIAQEFDGSGQTPFAPGRELWSFFGEHAAAPPGFPQAAGGCPQATDVHDVINLKLVLTAPKNATGLKFDFNFHSSEWPQYICSNFNDGFIAYLSAKGFNAGNPGNISFDAKNNPVSVNNGFFDRCTPQTVTGCEGARRATSECAAGVAELAGTGFGLLDRGCGSNGNATMGGATGWLTSQAPVTAGETFTLELMIWDTGDARLDSSVLIDKFQWLGGNVTTTTSRPPDVK